MCKSFNNEASWMLVNNSLALSQCLYHVMLSTVQSNDLQLCHLKEKSLKSLARVTEHIWQFHFTMGYCSCTASAWQWCFSGIQVSKQVTPAAFRAQTISLKQGRSLRLKNNQTKTFWMLSVFRLHSYLQRNNSRQNSSSLLSPER